MVVSALLRLVGFEFFKPTFPEIELTSYGYYITMSIFHILEVFLVFMILTNLSVKKCVLIALAYDLFTYMLIFIKLDNEIMFFYFDTYLILALPSMIDGKTSTAIKSLVYYIGIAIYQGIMMYGRYYPTDSKVNLFAYTLGIFDYYLFLLSIYLFKKGEITMHPRSLLFFGKFGDTLKIIGLYFILIVSTILWLVTPFYLLRIELLKKLRNIKMVKANGHATTPIKK